MTIHALPARSGAKALAAREEAPTILTLAVENMRCGGCIRSVERAAISVAGVRSARANLAAKRVSVAVETGRASEADVIAALSRAGFAAAPMQGTSQHTESSREFALLRRVAVAGFAAMNIMLLSVSVWSGRAGDMDQSLITLFCWLSALIALPTVVYAGQPFYASALSALKGRRLNMDVPISLAIILATGMSLYQTLVGSEQVYFDAAVSLLFFLLIGRYLDEHLRVRARGEAQNLLSLQSGIASLIGEGGSLRPIPAHVLVPGDKVLIGAGERVPADALVLSGSGDIDQSLITGETIPVAVAPGAQIYAGTLNLGSALTVEVTAADSATLLAEIGRLMAAAEQGKARYRRLADRAAQIYAPAVHGLGAATFLGWLIVGAPWQTALTYAIAVLIITCPCALALAVPAVQIAAASRLFRQGIVIKAADGLERVAEADMVVFDKTGTLTLGRPELVNDAAISDEVLESAARLAAASKHPYAQAVVAAARNRQIAVGAPEGVEEIPGRGLVRILPCGEERLGSAEWCGIAPGRGGASEVWYARDWRAPVRFRFADALRSDAAAVVQELKRRGHPIALLSGDRTAAVEQAARASGITTWQSELTPARKIDWLAECAKQGRKVLMVGDGLNDAPALAAAHASLSPASAADISQRAADFVFQGERLAPVLEVLSTAKRARNLSLQNFGVAFCYNIVAVPFAMAGYVTPLIAAIVMSTSSILVTLNAMRLAGMGKA
ncbi:heavy metal translocating P-type ATPase [Methyloceanibacter sp.]|uniref:heavy metal translocating P-type ATPase n=1 Tax=Methyloceanibacter sp. TaxID=1965321 RepID=UPI003C775BD9